MKWITASVFAIVSGISLAPVGFLTVGLSPKGTPAQIGAANSPRQSKVDALSEARAIKVSMEDHQSKLSFARQAIVDATKQNRPMLDQILVATELENLAAMRPMVADLRSLCRSILAQKAGLRENVQALRKDLTMATPAFQKAGEAFRTYAASEPFDDIKEDYLLVARTWDQLAAQVTKDQSKLQEEAQDAADFLAYLESTDRFLERLDQHLASVPTFGGMQGFNQQLRELQDYVTRFQALRQDLRGVHDRLHAGDSNASSKEGAPKLYRYDVTPSADGKLAVKLPAAKSVQAGQRLAMFRKNCALAGWVTIDSVDDNSPLALAHSDVKVAEGDFVALRGSE